MDNFIFRFNFRLFLFSGLICVLAYFFLWQVDYILSRFFESIFVVLFLLAFFSRKARERLLRDVGLILMVSFILYLAVAEVWYFLTRQEEFSTGYNVARHYVKVFLLVIIAFWMGLGKPTPWLTLFSLFFGLFIYIFFIYQGSDWSRGFQGSRVDFGIVNAQHTGVIFAVVFLALSIFFKRMIVFFGSFYFRIFASTFILFFIATSIFIIFSTQVRAVWLALILTFVFISVFFLMGNRYRFRILIGFALTFLVGFLITSHFGFVSVVKERILSEQEQIRYLIENRSTEGLENLSSTGLRVASWEAAISWFYQKPWFGWGSGANTYLIQNAEGHTDQIRGFGHLHNSYLEVLVAHGLLGSAILFLFVSWVGLTTVLNYRAGRMPTDMFVFVWSFFIFWLVVNFFESYVIYRTGFYLCAAVGGCAYYYWMNRRGIDEDSALH